MFQLSVKIVEKVSQPTLWIVFATVHASTINDIFADLDVPQVNTGPASGGLHLSILRRTPPSFSPRYGLSAVWTIHGMDCSVPVPGLVVDLVSSPGGLSQDIARYCEHESKEDVQLDLQPNCCRNLELWALPRHQTFGWRRGRYWASPQQRISQRRALQRVAALCLWLVPVG